MVRGIWYCNMFNVCIEVVVNIIFFLVLDMFWLFIYVQWCVRFDWFKSWDLGFQVIDLMYKFLGIVGLGDIGIVVVLKCEVVFGMRIYYQGLWCKLEVEKQFK